MLEDNIHKDNQESYCSDSEECVCVWGMGKKRAVNKGELCGLERKKKTGWHSQSEERKRSNMRVSCGEKGNKKTGAEGSKYGREWEKKSWDDWGGQEGKGQMR